MSHPIQYSASAIREAMDRLAELHIEFRRDPDGLRWTLEDELASELAQWADSPGRLAGAQAFWADAAWMSLHAHRWWVLSRRGRESVALLGPDTLGRYLAESTRLEIIAVGSGDWAWAYDELCGWLRRELGQQ